jgi:type VI secretion system secreted protein VgrG
MTYTQKSRAGRFQSPLGENALLLQRMIGEEAVSQPFRFTVDVVSENAAIEATSIVGEKAAVELALGNGKERFFHGVVAHFEQGGRDERLSSYRLELRPWLWVLTRHADCRIFQQKSVPDIVKEVFQNAGCTDFEFRLSGSYAERVFCVQYRETDFNFVSRLLEEEGMFYFFEHSKNSHLMVITDAADKVPVCPHQPEAHFAGDTGGRSDRDEVFGWRVGRTLHPGKYALKDFNFEDPSNALSVSAKTVAAIGKNDKLEIYDFHPGEYGDTGVGETIAKVRIEEQETEGVRIFGDGECRAFTAGHRFTLQDHFRKDQNGKPYVLLSVSHSFTQPSTFGSGGGDDGAYGNSFTCVPASVRLRPARTTPKPSIAGPQTAIVVGPGGEEIHVDQYGRVKLQFHWDRYGKRDENSSCWVRVTQAWAGKKWGALAHPRIGDEVIVEFLEGDPDKPIITGCVYNAQRMPPYDLPANKSQTGIKTRSTKEGGSADFNEIRFEDKKGSEELYIHAQKDENEVVENDQSVAIGHDQTIEVGNDRSLSVGANKSESVGKNKSITVSGSHTESVSGDLSQSVDKSRTMSITKNLTESIGESMSVDIGKDRTTSIGGKLTVTVAKDATFSIQGKRVESVTKECALSAKTVTVQADDEIVLKTGSAKIVMKKNGDITIDGKKITVKGSADVILKGSKVLAN